MRLSYPRQSGDKVIFRDDFTSLRHVIDNDGGVVGAPVVNRGVSGGQLRYYGPALSVAHAGSVSILCHAIVVVTGSDQALWSLGSGAARRLEVGIDATGRPYVWGSAKVLLGTALTDGHHDIAWTVSSAGEVKCYVNAEAWGSGTVTFGAATSGWRMVVGGSVLGTLPWSGTAKPIQIYRGVLDHDTVASETGVSDYFTPADVPGCLVWYEAVDNGVYLTEAVQPSNVNSDFSSWTGVNPNATPAGWLKAPAIGVAANHIEAAGNACRLVSDGTLTGVYKAGIIGNRYAMDVYVSAVGTGRISEWNDNLLIDSTGSKSVEYTLGGGGTLGIKRYAVPAGTDATFTNVIFKNLSRTRWLPRYGASWELTQATAVRMPYYSGGLRTDNGGGLGNTSAAARAAVKCLHDGSGGTVAYSHVVRSVTVGTKYIFDTGLLGSLAVGVHIQRGGALGTTLALYVVSGTAIILGIAHPDLVTLNQKCVSICRMGATSARYMLNGVEPAASNYTGAVGVASATQLAIGDPNGYSNADACDHRHCAIYQGQISDADCVRLNKYMGAA